MFVAPVGEKENYCSYVLASKSRRMVSTEIVFEFHNLFCPGYDHVPKHQDSRFIFRLQRGAMQNRSLIGPGQEESQKVQWGGGGVPGPGLLQMLHNLCMNCSEFFPSSRTETPTSLSAFHRHQKIVQRQNPKTAWDSQTGWLTLHGGALLKVCK